MVLVVKLVGILMVAMGAVYLAKPAVMKKYIAFWSEDQKIYLGSVISIIIGIAFILAASACSVTWFIVVVGIISILKGGLGFYLGPKKAKVMLETFSKKSNKNLRVFAIIAIVMGVAIISAV